jgi:NADPH:quinone reductase-like Zn-dependent oxidoreductase
MPTTTMKAERIHTFGGPDVLELDEVPCPQPGPGEVLVRVHAAGVNPVDWKIREGYMRAPLPSIMGSDFSGIVAEVGPGVHGFLVGDAVFGEVAEESGSYAEYAVAPVSQIAKRPEGIDDIQAAALPVASLTAWQALFDSGKLEPGQTVLIHAASGGVGSFAVQFAKWKGARVIGTTSAMHIDQVRQLGADQIIDYRATRFEDAVHEVDLVLDTIGGETQDRSWRVLKPGGLLVSVVQPPDQQKAIAHGVRGAFLISQARGDELDRIAELVASGRIKVVVQAVLPFDQARRAQELSQSGHAGGKIVLRLT